MKNVIIGCVIVILVGILYAFFNFFAFEQQKPTLESQIPTHWNLQDDIMLYFGDESGIRNYTIDILLDSQTLFRTEEIVLNKPKKFGISLPKPLTKLKDGTILQYKVCVSDWSNANFFTGNTTCANVFLTIDTSPPEIELLAYSPKISRSGSAFVLFKVKDITLDSVILSNGKNEFRAFRHYFDDVVLEPDESIFGAFIAWPLENMYFEGSIKVMDKALNTTKIALPIPKSLSATIRKSNIRLKPEFLEDKLASLIGQISEVQYDDFTDDKERFLFINEAMRDKDLTQILEATATIISDKSYIQNGITPFAPMKNAIVVGYFGDERSYYINKDLVSVVYHMGLDLASVRNAPIIASNSGVVILKQYLGLHGNTAIIYHGFGLSSLYAHMSDSQLKVGDEVKQSDIIGYTGASGWAFGDHLHLEILVQGYAVSIQEWLNTKWVENNVNAVFEQAHAKLIEKQTLEAN